MPFYDLKGYDDIEQGPDLTILTVKGKIKINLKLFQSTTFVKSNTLH